ncbi:MAG: DEAD/DEAH box helicase [Deltaproteobacteria bacterium]|nr:DEAD/DEAH box helicase [Deltaproteobacteria bacterium]
MSTENSGLDTLAQEDLLSRLEFHRHGLALLPSPEDKRPGMAIWVQERANGQEIRSCTCAISKNRTCEHQLNLSEAVRILKKRLGKKTLDEDFRSGIFYRVASILAEGSSGNPYRYQWNYYTRGEGMVLKVVDDEKGQLFSCPAVGERPSRLIERIEAPIDGDMIMPHRATVLNRLSLLTLSKDERTMKIMGMKSRRMAIEESFWFRVLYHAYLESWGLDRTFHVAIEEKTGDFFFECRHGSIDSLFSIRIPRSRVQRLLKDIGKHISPSDGLSISPVPLRSIFMISQKTELDLEIMPAVELVQKSGESRYYETEDLEKYRYGDLVYVRELGILAELEGRRDKKRKFTTPVKMVLKKAQVPSFIDEYREDLDAGVMRFDSKTRDLRIFRSYDSIEIEPSAIEHDWCWISMSYGFGNTKLSLGEILDARRQGQRYIATDEGWVDCTAPFLENLDAFLDGYSGDHDGETYRFSRQNIFRLHATANSPIRISGETGPARYLKDMLELKPVEHEPDLKGMTSTLRQYQSYGLKWIRFLYENAFGGLLCDDMGLGKTHQLMAFMAWLKNEGMGPFLVVCPTTVISHWQEKISMHAPVLRAAVYHGTGRDMASALAGSDVLITSYGILWRDIAIIKKTRWEAAVFDEVHIVKNSSTQAYKAAVNVDAGMKIGLTGTPIENTLLELKTLFDLVMPGYLGTDTHFTTRYLESPDDYDNGKDQRDELFRLISPFTLRRLKTSVLDELPPKIEDLRTCILSDDQVKLYRDAVSSRALSLVDALQETDKPIPYMHIFALLNMLKQICNHPALVEGDTAGYDQYESGKWDLFVEILDEALQSGHKVVVYSQYLGMIDIISRYLDGQGIDHVTLTGSSANRGEIIRRFNEYPACRVFVGSLKAGGVGIDLVSASVVIHYDRWWNAAKEDQATDRVHRIGQVRGVQVFKLVTKGTLEEKISAIIDKKRKLLNSVVKEDDPGLLKAFTREELIGILSTVNIGTSGVEAEKGQQGIQ